MQALGRRSQLSLVHRVASCFSSQRSLTTTATHRASLLQPCPANSPSTTCLVGRGTLSSPWFAIQHRGAKVLGTDVRSGNVIQRKGRIFQVIKSQHTQHGRGGAKIQVELRDVDTGNKVTESFRTDEALEKLFVEEKPFTFLYTDGDSVVLMDPDTYDQMEISKDLFGKAAAYLKDEMKVSVHIIDGKPMSASIPTRVTCTVAEAQSHIKGMHATPQYKRVLLDNGLTMLVPPFIESGDQIIINTIDDSYITRAKE